MVDIGNPEISESGLSRNKTEINRLQKDLHIGSETSEKLFGAINRYTTEQGMVGKVESRSLERVPSYNNAVFVFTPDRGEKVAVKIFDIGVKDGEERFKAESESRKFLLESGAFGAESGIYIPEQKFEDKENGAIFTKYVENLKPVQLVDPNGQIPGELSDFLIRLNGIRANPDNLEKYPYESKYAAKSAYVTYHEAVRRFEEFRVWLNSTENTSGIAKWCKETNFLENMDAHFQNALSSVDMGVMNRSIEPSEMRFNWGDVSLPNMKWLTEGGKKVLVPLDMEYAGWDHFSAGVVSFLLHHQSEDIAPGAKRDFLQKFIKDSKLNSSQIEDLDARLVMGELLYITRKLLPVERPARETPWLSASRAYGQSWDNLKISHFLEPAARRIKTGFLRVED